MTLLKSPNSFGCRNDYSVVEIFWKKLRRKWRPVGQMSHYVFRSGLMEVKNPHEELQSRSLIGRPCLHINQAFSAYLIEGWHFSYTS